MRILVEAIKALQSELLRLSEGKPYSLIEPGNDINTESILQAAWNILKTVEDALKSPFPAILYLNRKQSKLENWSYYLFNTMDYKFRMIDPKIYELGRALLPFIDTLTQDEKLISYIPKGLLKEVLAKIAEFKQRFIQDLEAFEASLATKKPATLVIIKESKAETTAPLLEIPLPPEAIVIPLEPPLEAQISALPLSTDSTDMVIEIASIPASDSTGIYDQIKQEFFGSDPTKIGGIFGAYLKERANTYFLLDLFEHCVSYLFSCIGYKSSALKREEYLSQLHSTINVMDPSLTERIDQGPRLFSSRKNHTNLSLNSQLHLLQNRLDELKGTSCH